MRFLKKGSDENYISSEEVVKIRLESIGIKPLNKIGFIKKFFLKCYNITDIRTIVEKYDSIKKELKSKNKELLESIDIINKNQKSLENDLTEKITIIKEKEKNIFDIKDKHKKELLKLGKTIEEINYKNSSLESEVIHLRKDLDECKLNLNKKFDTKIKDTSNFLDKLLKKNESLTKENQVLKEEIKKLKSKKVTK